MASINKLSIRGVRAFSPDDAEQVVEFYFPLTIITGANGCGKTTVIESLKFALSGSMPPGGAARSAGQSFVHDPRSIGQTVVKANVKLRFTNKAGSSMVVIRSMEVTQKKTTMQFKQLDGVIRTIDAETGERVTLSHKCGELDKQIPSLLGVSKAILDYVLFVHQEDSSWPLQEASVLKKRFDDIFDSTRYTKALESFRKTKKELASEVKNIKIAVAEFASHKHAAKGFRKEREQQNYSLQKVEEEIDECNRIEKESTKEQEKYDAICEKVTEIVDKLNEKRQELGNLKEITKKQRSMLEKDLTKELSMEVLQEKLKDFDKEMVNFKQKQDDLQRELQELETEIEDLRQKEMRLNSSKGKVAAEKEAQDKRLRDRFVMMSKISQTYTLVLGPSMTQLSVDDSFTQGSIQTALVGEAPPPPMAKEDVQSFLRTLREKEEELKEGLRSHKAKFRLQEEEFNTALQDLIGNKNAYENERKKLVKENQDIENEQRQLGRDFGGKRMKKSSLDDTREQVKQAQKDLDDMMKNDGRVTLAAEIRAFNDKLDTIKDDMEFKQSAKGRLKSSAGKRVKLDLMKETLQSEAKSLKESLEAKRDLLKNFVIDVPDDIPDDATITNLVPEICDSIHTEYQKAKRKAKTASDSLDKAKTDIATALATLQSSKQSLTGLEKRRDFLKKSDQSVGKIKRLVRDMDEAGFLVDSYDVDSKDPQELLDFFARTLQEMEDESPEDLPSDVLAKVMKRIKKMGKADRECPCCRRGFSGDEQKAFSEAMKTLADKEDSPLLRGDSEALKIYRAKIAEVEGQRTLVKNCSNDLNEYRRILSEIAEQKPKVEGGNNLIKAKRKEVDKVDAEATEARKHEEALRDLNEMSKRWRDHSGRIEEQNSNITDKLEALNCETAGTAGDGTLDEVEEALQRMQEEQAALYEKISKKNKKIAKINVDVTALQTTATSLNDMLKRKEEKFAEEQKASERKQFLEERKTAISKEISKLSEQITSLQQKVKTKEAEKSRLYSHSNDEEIKLNETLNLFLSDLKHMQDLIKKIDEFANNDEADSLEKIEMDVAKVVAKIKEKQDQCVDLKPQLDNASKVVDDSERQKKLLKDNIDLHVSEAEQEALEQRIEELTKEHDSVEGADTAQQHIDEHARRVEDSKNKKNRLSGRRAEIVEQIRSLQRKLQSPEYKNVDAEHKEAVIKQETTQLAALDLEKYASALDKALLRFHSIKIAEINKIIKELWQKCYQGQDITNIELESGQDSRAAKSYNYRVVMSKGQTKMDMRGRCSAGQRVLASIVIRLALAETFGVNCGCLVLDEPTVNLDEHNKRALAKAMAQIIANRSAQSNFQLVLITHEEDFISEMKDALSTQTGFSMPEKYFVVRREEGHDRKYYSKIDAVDWDELL